MKFKIGDKVKVNWPGDLADGKVGKIIHIERAVCVVKLEDFKYGWACRRTGEPNCWDIFPKYLEKLGKVGKKKDYVYILMSFGQDYDRVVAVSKSEKKLKAKRQWLEANFLDYSFGLIKKELK